MAFDAIDSSVQAIKDKPWCKDLRLCIGGKGNYRNKTAFSYPYKGERPPKPIMYPVVRQYVEEKYKDIIIIEDGIEADDVTAIMGWWGYKKAKKTGNKLDSPIIMIHIDKDINQVPGWHWNPDQKEENPHWIMPSQADKYFYTQMLTGDRTDNIKGLPGTTESIKKKFGISTKGVGVAGAERILANRDKMLENILWCYKEYYTEFPFQHFHGKELQNVEWHIMLNESFQLIRMMEEKNKIPNVYDYLKRYNIDYEKI